MNIVRNLNYSEVMFAQLWGWSQEPDSNLSRFLGCTFWVCVNPLNHTFFSLTWKFSFPTVSGTQTDCYSSFGFYIPFGGNFAFMSRCQSLFSVRYTPSPQWTEIGSSEIDSSSSPLHCLLVLLCPEIVFRVRLEWNRCSSTGRAGLWKSSG